MNKKKNEVYVCFGGRARRQDEEFVLRMKEENEA